MIHTDCGGKLIVIDSMQKQDGKNLIITRLRKCDKCGYKVYSTEKIADGSSKEGYKHKCYY